MRVCACVSGFDPYTPGEVSSVVGYKGAMWSHPSTLVGFAWWYGQFRLVMCNFSVCICICVRTFVCVCGGGGIGVSVGVGVWVCWWV